VAFMSVLPSSSAAVLRLRPTPVMSYEFMAENWSLGTKRVKRSGMPSANMVRMALHAAKISRREQSGRGGSLSHPPGCCGWPCMPQRFQGGNNRAEEVPSPPPLPGWCGGPRKHSTFSEDLEGEGVALQHCARLAGVLFGAFSARLPPTPPPPRFSPPHPALINSLFQFLNSAGSTAPRFRPQTLYPNLQSPPKISQVIVSACQRCML